MAQTVDHLTADESDLVFDILENGLPPEDIDRKIMVAVLVLLGYRDVDVSAPDVYLRSAIRCDIEQRDDMKREIARQQERRKARPAIEVLYKAFCDFLPRWQRTRRRHTVMHFAMPHVPTRCPRCAAVYVNHEHPLKPGVIMMSTCQCRLVSDHAVGVTHLQPAPPSSP